MADDQEKEERLRQARERAAAIRQQWEAKRGAGGAAPARPAESDEEREERRRQARERAEALRREREGQGAAAARPQAPAAAAPTATAESAAATAEAPPPEGGWRMAGGEARQTVAAQRGEPVAVGVRRPRAEALPGTAVAAPPAVERRVSRRDFLRLSFFGGLGLSGLISGLALWNFMWRRNVTGFGGVMTVPASQLPQPGDPPAYFIQGKFYLVNLRPNEGVLGQFGTPNPNGGMLALFQKCPHLGCRVPWAPTYEYEGSGIVGWFRCPCHGSTYSKAGIRVFGPAPRPMDTMDLSFDADGNAVVNTGQITLGGQDNPLRAVRPPGAVTNIWNRLRRKV